jgi:hypothetical protein
VLHERQVACIHQLCHRRAVFAAVQPDALLHKWLPQASKLCSSNHCHTVCPHSPAAWQTPAYCYSTNATLTFTHLPDNLCALPNQHRLTPSRICWLADCCTASIQQSTAFTLAHPNPPAAWQTAAY